MAEPEEHPEAVGATSSPSVDNNWEVFGEPHENIALCRHEKLAVAENRLRETSSEYGAIDDGPQQEALFTLDGPDEDGCVWICATQSDWCQNLGPREKVAEVFTQWLAQTD